MKTREERRAEHILATMGRCKYFTGVQHDVCEIGVKYADVQGKDVPRGLPCLSWDANGAVCEKREVLTRDQAEAEERESEAAITRVMTAMKAVREKHGKARGIQDSMPCPNACGGTLRYSISSYNGHMHGQCSTEGCASWMQ